MVCRASDSGADQGALNVEVAQPGSRPLGTELRGSDLAWGPETQLAQQWSAAELFTARWVEKLRTRCPPYKGAAICGAEA